MNTITIIVTAFLAILIIYIIALYNRFVRHINRAKEAWADIENQFKRRYDLIPNLVNSVKGYAAHESKTLEAVISARNSAINAVNDHATDKDRIEKEDGLSGALKSLFALSESYPDLKANQNFLELQRELSDTENRLQAARRFYNVNVRDLNVSIEMFPSNVIAKIFRFEKMNFYDLGDEKEVASKPVEVTF